MDPNKKKKHTMGRRKIELKKIEEKSSRQVTFTKRRMGLFKKASELCILSGAEAAIFVASPKGKIFTFGHPNVETIIGRYMHDHNDNLQGSEGHSCQFTANLEQLRLLEAERDRLKMMDNGRGRKGNWWDCSVGDMELEELVKFRECLEELKKKVELNAVEKGIQRNIREQINYEDCFDKQLQMDAQDVNMKPLIIAPHHDDYDFGFHKPSNLGF